MSGFRRTVMQYVVSYMKNGIMLSTLFKANSDKELRDQVLSITGYDIDIRSEYEKVAIVILGESGRVYSCSFDL